MLKLWKSLKNIRVALRNRNVEIKKGEGMKMVKTEISGSFQLGGRLLAAVFFFSAGILLAADAELLKDGACTSAAGGEKKDVWSIYVEARGCDKTLVTHDHAVGHLAPGSFRMIPSTRKNASATVYQVVDMALTVGQSYELKGWVMGKNLTGASLKAGIRAEFRKADGKFIGKELVKIVDEGTPSGEWQSGTLRVKIPDEATIIYFTFWGEFKSYPENAAAPEIYFDDCSMVAVKP